MQVKDALANKLVGYQTPVSFNPLTEELTLASPHSRLLLPLIKGPELIDWLADVELAMAKEAKPHETLEGISGQLAELQVTYSSL